MRKLTLHLDALRVETFATRDEATENPGTVQAHEYEEDSAVHTCGCPTYARTCGCSAYRTCSPNYTCYNTCDCPSWSGPECNTVCVG